MTGSEMLRRDLFLTVDTISTNLLQYVISGDWWQYPRGVLTVFCTSSQAPQKSQLITFWHDLTIQGSQLPRPGFARIESDLPVAGFVGPKALKVAEKSCWPSSWRQNDVIEKTRGYEFLILLHNSNINISQRLFNSTPGIPQYVDFFTCFL